MDMTTCTDGASAHTQADTADTGNLFFGPAQTAASKCLCPLPAGMRRQLTEAYTRQPRLPMPAGYWRAVCCAGNAGSRPASGRGLTTARPILSFGTGVPLPTANRYTHVVDCALRAFGCRLRAAHLHLSTARYTLRAPTVNCLLTTSGSRLCTINFHLRFVDCVLSVANMWLYWLTPEIDN